MKKAFRDYRQAVKKLSEKPLPDQFPAMLGNKSGTVSTGSGRLVYVTTFEGQVLTVINRAIPNAPGDVVMVGKREGSSSLEVLYSINNNSSIPTDINIAGLVDPHAATHQYPGYDTVFVKGDQFLPGLVLPYTAFTVRAFPWTYAKRFSAGYVFSPGSDLDLSELVPDSGVRWALIEYNDLGEVEVTSSPTYSERTDLTGDNIPTPTFTASHAIVLDSDYNYLERSNLRNDFWDLRWAVDLPKITLHYRALMWEADPGGGWHFMYDDELQDQPMYTELELE